MSLRHVFSIAAAALALAPASAFAQGAGDDQYNDPFGDEQEETATPAPTAQAPAATATPAPATPSQATPVPSGPQATATPVPSGPTLPHTGIDGWPIAIGGAVLLGSGLALRARLREPV
jgi:LPXTG-motif cell wall-anchored protein